MNMRSDIAKLVGRSEFTVRQLAEVSEISIEAARSRVARYLEEGVIERTPEVLQYLGPDGRPGRGRPAHLYRVR
jgi:predicted ArsR family transcriptional regulator